ncbi:hypothetical protein BDA96_04G327500 [Sorghum bicolor]|uniref:Uncharacterized protein n=1 Tax=Sorghum bicolor TaxID=4558 RepID=A0A921R8C4_SORBI|nr:hypothetical protein BDA96_04G327500 [Sorghum bicolor]
MIHHRRPPVRTPRNRSKTIQRHSPPHKLPAQSRSPPSSVPNSHAEPPNSAPTDPPAATADGDLTVEPLLPPTQPGRSTSMETERIRELILLTLRAPHSRLALVGGNHTAARFCTR